MIFALIISLALYTLVLWAIGKTLPRYLEKGMKGVSSAIYVLGYGAYCTTWTYYGSLEGVQNNGLFYFAVYVGPILSSFLWKTILYRIVELKRSYEITNITDLINVIYRRSEKTVVFVTCFLFIGMLPYISVQMKAVNSSIRFFSNTEGPLLFGIDLFVLCSFIFFTLFFGNKKLADKSDQYGLSTIIAVESLVKLIGMCLIGLVVLYFLLFDHEKSIVMDRLFHENPIFGSEVFFSKTNKWFYTIFVSAFAFLFLPRQFHVSILELKKKTDIVKATQYVPLYLIIMTVFIIPISLYGASFLQEVQASNFSLAIPESLGLHWLSIIIFLGGYSAASGMVVLEVTSLTSMITNNLIIPFAQRKRKEDIFKKLYFIKQITAVVLMILAFLYFELVAKNFPIIATGMVSFCCIFQLAPSFLGGLFWKGAHRLGMKISIYSGAALWFYTLFLPGIIESFSPSSSFIHHGPFGIEFLKPYALFGVEEFDKIGHNFFWTMAVNLPCFFYFSKLGRRLEESNFVEQEIVSESLSTVRFLEQYSKSLKRYLDKDQAHIKTEEIKRKFAIEDKIGVEDFCDLVSYCESYLSQLVGSISAEREVQTILSERQKTALEKAKRYMNDRNVMAREKLSGLRVLASGMAHELNNPINILDTSTQALLMKLEELKKKKSEGADESELFSIVDELGALSSVVRNGSRRTADVLSTILSKTECSNLIVEQENIENLIRSSFSEAKEKERLSINVNFTIHCALSSRIPCSKRDLTKAFQEIFSNSFYGLLEKAKEDSDFKATIHVSIDQVRSLARIEVSDNGVGVKEGELPMMDLPFFTKRPTGKGNVGLGLTMVHDIIHAHSGDMKIKSKKDGGLSVILTLPLVR